MGLWDLTEVAAESIFKGLVILTPVFILTYRAYKKKQLSSSQDRFIAYESSMQQRWQEIEQRNKQKYAYLFEPRL